jgi:hypothetical protein
MFNNKKAAFSKLSLHFVFEFNNNLVHLQGRSGSSLDTLDNALLGGTKDILEHNRPYCQFGAQHIKKNYKPASSLLRQPQFAVQLPPLGRHVRLQVATKLPTTTIRQNNRCSVPTEIRLPGIGHSSNLDVSLTSGAIICLLKACSSGVRTITCCCDP